MNKVFNPKLFSLLRQGVDKHQLPQDVMSGIVVGVVALPLSIAFAVACGLSPEKGLITAVVAGFIISALGGSRVQIGGPTGADYLWSLTFGGAPEVLSTFLDCRLYQWYCFGYFFYTD